MISSKPINTSERGTLLTHIYVDAMPLVKRTQRRINNLSWVAVFGLLGASSARPSQGLNILCPYTNDIPPTAVSKAMSHERLEENTGLVACHALTIDRTTW